MGLDRPEDPSPPTVLHPDPTTFVPLMEDSPPEAWLALKWGNLSLVLLAASPGERNLGLEGLSLSRHWGSWEVWEELQGCKELQGCQEHGQLCSAMTDVWTRHEDFNWTSLSQEQPDLNFSCEGCDMQDLRAKVEK